MIKATGSAASRNGDVPWRELDEPTRQFYLKALEILDNSGVKYCVAGAYALAAHAGIVRHTKDLDIFLRREDVAQVMKMFKRNGCHTERTHPHWLAKAFAVDPPDVFVDLIFRAASGIWEVDDEWLSHGQPGPVVGRDAPLCPPEELIWSKAMVMERDRFDGADIAHVIHSKGTRMEWRRLMRRAGGYEGILLGHLAFYRFIYPNDPENVPDDIFEELFERVRNQKEAPQQVCRGTLVSWEQYLPDVQEWGMHDGRLRPWGNLTQAEIDRWTNAEK